MSFSPNPTRPKLGRPKCNINPTIFFYFDSKRAKQLTPRFRTSNSLKLKQYEIIRRSARIITLLISLSRGNFFPKLFPLKSTFFYPKLFPFKSIFSSPSFWPFHFGKVSCPTNYPDPTLQSRSSYIIKTAHVSKTAFMPTKPLIRIPLFISKNPPIPLISNFLL